MALMVVKLWQGHLQRCPNIFIISIDRSHHTFSRRRVLTPSRSELSALDSLRSLSAIGTAQWFIKARRYDEVADQHAIVESHYFGVNLEVVRRFFWVCVGSAGVRGTVLRV